MWIIGHRGSAGTEPENSLAGLDAAIAAGADWVEIDIRCVDGSLIVLHDETLDRTTNGSGSIYGYRFNDLREFRLANGECIPLLDEVLDRIDARCGLNIEIKQCSLSGELNALLARTVRRQPAWRGKLMLSSFLREPLRALAARSPQGTYLAVLSEDNAAAALAFGLEIGARALNIALGELEREIVDLTHARGLRLLVYTVNDARDIARCHELGVDGIFTDFPGRAIAFLRERLMI